MKRLVDWGQAIAIAAGGPGLFLIAFVDASVFSLPELNDVLVIWMTLRDKPFLLYYAGMAAAGSVAGSLVVYYAGWKGGEAMLRGRFKSDQVDRTLARFRKWGVAAVIVPAILPPPMPFKLFCLAAGVAGMSPLTFASGTAIGRGLRYAGEAVLALYFGNLVLEYLHAPGNAVAWWTAGLTAAALAVYYWRQQRRRAAI
jgi:membrane protein YqaA with SNARE-associated domain